MFPMPGDAQIDEMARDIFENSMREPVHIIVNNHAAASGSPGPFPEELMDGRCRKEALKRAGYQSPLEANTNGVRYHNAIKWDSKHKRWVPDCDPVKFILSMNIHRRHLTAEQRRALILCLLKADPTASDSALAKVTKASDKTIAAARQAAVQSSEIPNVAHRPIEKARAEFEKHPEMSVKELAEAAGVSKGTAATARRAPIKPSKPKPAPAVKEQRLDVLLEPFCEELPVTKNQARRSIALCCIIAFRVGLRHKEIIDIVDPLRAA